MQELKARPRTELKKRVKTLRKEGVLPAVLYGEGISTLPLAVSHKEFERAYQAAGESTLVKLHVEGKEHNVLIYDVARDPLKDIPLHADFYAVRMDKLLRASIQIEFVGESPAVKNEGGILVRVVKELEVEALPQDLPHAIRADLSGLIALESKLFVRDLVLPQGVKVLAGGEEIIALIETPRSEEELAALEKAPEEAGVVEVKTEREIKESMKVKESEEKEGEEAGKK